MALSIIIFVFFSGVTTYVIMPLDKTSQLGLWHFVLPCEDRWRYHQISVRFNLKPVVHVMRAWDFAYRQARKGDWEMAARDRERFRKRVADLEPVLGPALQSTLRDKIYTERFGGEEKNAQDLTLPMQ